MVFQRPGAGGMFFNPDDIRQATTTHRGLMSSADKALVNQLVTDTGWVDLGTVAVYAANWGPYAGGNNFRPMVRKLATGQLLFRGLVVKGVALALPEVMFTLNAGWRIGDAGYLGGGVATPYAAASFAGYAELRADQTGAVALQAGGSATWTAIAGVTYMVN